MVSLIGCEQEAAVLEHMRDILKLFIELDRSLQPYGAFSHGGNSGDGDGDGLALAHASDEHGRVEISSNGSYHQWMSEDEQCGKVATSTSTNTSISISNGNDGENVTDRGRQVLYAEEIFIHFTS